jgi:cAMP-dependent protein kinase regulator
MKSFLFQELDELSMDVIIDAMTELVVQPAECVVKEGEEGDCLFIVDSGTFNCYKQDGESKYGRFLKSCSSGDVFGELALMYNSPRAASVVSQELGCLWKLDRLAFQFLLQSSHMKKRETYEEFIKRIPLFSTFGPYEISQVLEAMVSREFRSGELIIEEGHQEADAFYIIQSGSAAAYKHNTLVMQYNIPGEYFGELSLIHEGPRMASVKAGPGGCRVLTIDRDSFSRLLGDIEELRERTYSC